MRRNIFSQKFRERTAKCLVVNDCYKNKTVLSYAYFYFVGVKMENKGRAYRTANYLHSTKPEMSQFSMLYIDNTNSFCSVLVLRIDIKSQYPSSNTSMVKL